MINPYVHFDHIGLRLIAVIAIFAALFWPMFRAPMGRVLHGALHATLHPHSPSALARGLIIVGRRSHKAKH